MLSIVVRIVHFRNVLSVVRSSWIAIAMLQRLADVAEEAVGDAEVGRGEAREARVARRHVPRARRRVVRAQVQDEAVDEDRGLYDVRRGQARRR